MGACVFFLEADAVEEEIIFVIAAPVADMAEAGGLECKGQLNSSHRLFDYVEKVPISEQGMPTAITPVSMQSTYPCSILLHRKSGLLQWRVNLAKFVTYK